MNTLYLHIGTPKTGSSAIQFFLKENTEWLRTKGIYYPTSSDEPSHLKYMLSNGNGAKLAWLEIDRVYHQFSVLCSMFVPENNDLLLSSEVFWMIQDKAGYFTQLKRLPFQIKIIVYLRRQDEYLSSVINQWVKEGRKNASIKYPDCLSADNPFLQGTDYLGELEKIAGVIGKENISVRRYSKRIDLISDFMETLGVRLDDNMVLPPKTVNPHLSWRSLKLMCLVNNYIPNRNVRKSISNFLLDLSVKFHKGTSDMFLWNEKVRQQILDKYEESNNKLARLYLNEDSLFER